MRIIHGSRSWYVKVYDFESFLDSEIEDKVVGFKREIILPKTDDGHAVIDWYKIMGDTSILMKNQDLCNNLEDEFQDKIPGDSILSKLDTKKGWIKK